MTLGILPLIGSHSQAADWRLTGADPASFGAVHAFRVGGGHTRAIGKTASYGF